MGCLLNVMIFRCRGQIKVKGKGDMITYFLLDRSSHNWMVYNECRENRGTQFNCTFSSIYCNQF